MCALGCPFEPGVAQSNFRSSIATEVRRDPVFHPVICYSSAWGFHRNVYDVWTRLGKLASQLMFEGAVPVAWMEQEVAQEVRAFLESIQVLCILLTVSHAD